MPHPEPVDHRLTPTPALLAERDALVARLDKGWQVPVAKMTDELHERWAGILYEYQRIENELRWRRTHA